MQCQETISRGLWGNCHIKQGNTKLVINLDIVGFMLKDYHTSLCDIMKLDLVGYGVGARIIRGLHKGLSD